MKKTSIIKYSASLLLAAVLFYFAFRNVDFKDFAKKASDANYWWIFASIVISIFSHWLRSYRWNLMLRPMGYKVTEFRTLVALMTGYLANLALPRLGEITRCAVLKKNDGVPMSVGFGTVIAERVIDFFILLILILADLIIEFDKVYTYFMGMINIDRFGSPGLLLFVLIVLMALGFTTVIFAIRKLDSAEFTNPMLQNFKSFVGEMKNGLFSLRKLQSRSGFLFSTIGIWLAYYLMSYIIFFAIEETSGLGFGAGLSILAAAGVAMVVPVQGGIGAYHFLVGGVLVLYGIEATTGMFFATLLHTSQLVFYIVVGGLSILTSVFLTKNKEISIKEPLVN